MPFGYYYCDDYGVMVPKWLKETGDRIQENGRTEYGGRKTEIRIMVNETG